MRTWAETAASKAWRRLKACKEPACESCREDEERLRRYFVKPGERACPSAVDVREKARERWG